MESLIISVSSRNWYIFPTFFLDGDGVNHYRSYPDTCDALFNLAAEIGPVNVFGNAYWYYEHGERKSFFIQKRTNIQKIRTKIFKFMNKLVSKKG